MAYQVRVNGYIYMCQPQRANSLERFLDVVRCTMGVGTEDKNAAEAKPLFSIEWLENVKAIKDAIAASASMPHYIHDIHCPHIILLRKLREVTEYDRVCVTNHMKTRDEKDT